MDFTLKKYTELLWMIGQNDRRSSEFCLSDAPRQYGLWEQVPANLTYTIGESNEKTDWYYAQTQKNGTWTIKFNLNERPAGRVYLTASIAGCSGTGSTINVKVNGTQRATWKPGVNDASVYVGKTDNSDALASILSEKDFYAIFIGTPRHNEEHRLDILDVAVKYNPEVIVLFPGLDDTLDMAIYRLNSLGYEGNVITVSSLDEIIELVAEYSHEEAILIGGNGQDTIIEIQERIKLISEKLM